MTKSKKKKTNPVAKLARKTVGLMVRVGDALEAAEAAAQAAEAATVAAYAARVASPIEPPAPEPVLSLATPLESPDGPPQSLDPSPAFCAVEIAPAPAVPATPAPVVAVADDGARARAAIEDYGTAHNLRALDMPSRDVLVDALTRAMAEHGAAFDAARMRSLLDEQMRAHLRTLGTRARSRIGGGP